MKQHIVTFSLFHFQGIANQFWAFAQMGRSPFLFKNVSGLSFNKMLGSGGGNGFSISPNFSVYSLLCVWENEDAANDFFEKNTTFKQFLAKSKMQYTVFGETATAHGLWDNATPFTPTVQLDNTKLVAVLTRATIKWRYLPYFWKFVPRTSASVYAQAGRLFSIGVGEVPIVQQATFSIWENPQKMMEFAYKSKFHSEVVQKTRALGWYREELFARFHLYKAVGDWFDLKVL
jgi:hypothetical protein